MAIRYAGTMAMNGQSRTMQVAVTVAAHPQGGWAVTEKAALPQGEVFDSTRLEAKTLVPLSRNVHQGPVSIGLTFDGTSASGQMSMGGQPQPIKADMGGRLFADGAGSYLAIGRLPLAAGYATTIRNFDMQKAKASFRQVTVTGTERVTVPAGSYDANVVEITEEGGASKTTLWVAKETSVPVKIVAAQGPLAITLEMAK